MVQEGRDEGKWLRGCRARWLYGGRDGIDDCWGCRARFHGGGGIDGDFREVENQMKVNGGWGVVQHGIWGRELLGCRAGFHEKWGMGVKDLWVKSRIPWLGRQVVWPPGRFYPI